MDFKDFLLGALGATVFQYFYIKTNNTFGIVDNGKDVLNQQYLIYRDLYINCVSKPFDKKISKSEAKKYLDSFVKSIKETPNLLNYLSTPLVSWLEDYVNTGCTENKIPSIQYQIDQDFDKIKYKLGYPSHTKNKQKVFYAMLGMVSMALSFIYILLIFLFSSEAQIVKNVLIFIMLLFLLIMIYLLSFIFKYQGYARSLFSEFLDTMKWLKNPFIQFLKNHSFNKKCNTKSNSANGPDQ